MALGSNKTAYQSKCIIMPMWLVPDVICWPSVAGTFLQTPSSLTDWFAQWPFSSKSSKHVHFPTVRA